MSNADILLSLFLSRHILIIRVIAEAPLLGENMVAGSKILRLWACCRPPGSYKR